MKNKIAVLIMILIQAMPVMAESDYNESDNTAGDQQEMSSSERNKAISNQIGELSARTDELLDIAKKIAVMMKIPDELKTREEIEQARKAMNDMEVKLDANELSLFDDKSIKLNEDMDILERDISVRLSESNGENDAELEELTKRTDKLKNKIEQIGGQITDIRYTFSNRDEMLLAAENKIKLYKDQAEQEKRLAEIKEEEHKKVLELRSHANLDEEEYIVPVFECSVKGAYWCFSSSHKIYAITGYVKTKDDSPVTAAIYQEVGQGEVQDYTKEKANALEHYGLLERIWLSRDGTLPHVYMARNRR